MATFFTKLLIRFGVAVWFLEIRDLLYGAYILIIDFDARLYTCWISLGFTYLLCFKVAKTLSIFSTGGKGSVAVLLSSWDGPMLDWYWLCTP